MFKPVIRVFVYCGNEAVSTIKDCVDSIVKVECQDAQVIVYLVDDLR